MAASTDINFYVHTNTNAPQLTNNYGCMIQVLDACLVNGFGSQVVTSLVASGTTVTATFGTAHNFMQYQVIKIDGANQDEFNGKHRILTIPNATTITFELSAVPSITTATGTITCSLPPLEWEKPFGNTGSKAAYHSTNMLLPSRPFLRVVDELDPVWNSTYAKYAKVALVEDMIDIDTMLGSIAPYDSQMPNKNWIGTGSGTTALNGWAKWYYAHYASFSASNSYGDNATPVNGNRQWILVRNKDYFYIMPGVTPVDMYYSPYGFGNYKSLINNDGSANFLSAVYQYNQASGGGYKAGYVPIFGNGANQKLLLQRGYKQYAAYTESKCVSLNPTTTQYYMRSGSSDYIGAQSLTGIAPFLPIFINEDVLRGEIPGIYQLFQKTPYANLQVIEKDSVLYIAVNCGTGTDGYTLQATGQIIVKIGDL